MKYLKKYKLFLEEDEFEIKDTDQEDVKMSKEQLNKLKKDIAEYQANKAKIDEIFKKFENPEEASKEVEKILGTEDKNPFLVEYVSLVRIEKEISKLHDDNANDKIKIDDFNQELSITTNDTTKEAIKFKISDIKNRMSKRNKDISDKEKELIELEQKHKEKIIEKDKNIKDWIQKISSPEQK